MAMQGSTIRILEAANFSRPQALALAEAIEGEIRGADLVTVPVMDVRFSHVDARFSELRQELAGLEARMTNKMMAMGISTTGIMVSVMLYLLKK